MDNKSVFAKRMRSARLKANLSQAELSRKTNIAAATLSTYESIENPKSPPIDKASAIAQELNVSLDWLCGLSSEQLIEDSQKLTAEIVVNAIITLSKLSECRIEPGYNDLTNENYLSIYIANSNLAEFGNEYSKIIDFIKSADYPDYLKAGLKTTLLNKFITQYQVKNNSFISNSEAERQKDMAAMTDDFELIDDTKDMPF